MGTRGEARNRRHMDHHCLYFQSTQQSGQRGVMEGPLILGVSMGGLMEVVISQLSLKSEYD